MDKEAALRALDEIADCLAHDGKPDLAERARDAVAALRRNGHGHADAIGAAEAASLLGVRNVGMIGRWAREGRLEACYVDGRFTVSRRSVDRLAESPVVANERAFERQMDEALAPFDFGDEEIPPSVLPHTGRAPWDRVDAERS